jgi:hypothetical protein
MMGLDLTMMSTNGTAKRSAGQRHQSAWPNCSGRALCRHGDADPPQRRPNNYVSDGKLGLNENYGSLYAAQMRPFTSPLGSRIPCQAPPWGNIAGIDLLTGKTVWQSSATPRSCHCRLKLGVPNIGGRSPPRAASSLSGTLHYFVRAYEVTSVDDLSERQRTVISRRRCQRPRLDEHQSGRCCNRLRSAEVGRYG